MIAELTTERFLLRSIDPEVDNFEDYLLWMRDEESNPYIQSVNINITFEELRDYVSSKNESNNALLFGIFLSNTSKHIGNVKLEPIHPKEEATLGILIGEQEWRGKGVGFEVISRIIDYSFNELKLNRIKLGVDRSNRAAVKLYEKLGFEPENKDQTSPGIIMALKRD